MLTLEETQEQIEEKKYPPKEKDNWKPLGRVVGLQAPKAPGMPKVSPKQNLQTLMKNLDRSCQNVKTKKMQENE